MFFTQINIKKNMGYVASIITSRLGYNKKWNLSWVMSAKNYDENIQKDLLMLNMVNPLNLGRFQIKQLIVPVISSFSVVSLKIFGRLTRKERAAVIIRKFRRVTLAKKSADIEHASQSKALRFGMSAVSAWFMLKDEGAKPMAYNFSMSIFPYLTRAPKNLELPKIKRKIYYIFVKYGSSGSKIAKDVGKISKKASEVQKANFKPTSQSSQNHQPTTPLQPVTPPSTPLPSADATMNQETVTATSEQKTPGFFKHEPKTKKTEEQITEKQKDEEEIKKDLQQITSDIKKTVDSTKHAGKPADISGSTIAVGSRSEGITVFARYYASFAAGSRLPTKEPKEPEEIKEDGSIMMSTYDHTNKDCGHQIIVNLDSITTAGILDVHGVFTSSAKPYQNFDHHLVSKKNYSGQDKNQYVHVYPAVRKLHISAITFSPELMEILRSNPEYFSVLETINEIHRLHGDAKVASPMEVINIIKEHKK